MVDRARELNQLSYFGSKGISTSPWLPGAAEATAAAMRREDIRILSRAQVPSQSDFTCDALWCNMSPNDMSRESTSAKALSETVFWILLSLAGEPQHGYAVMRSVDTLSEGRVRLTTGTLYGALARLLEHRWIERFESQDTARDKQAYRLTALGRVRLRDETARLRHVTRLATSRLKSKEV